jgi:hypothetical protein
VETTNERNAMTNRRRLQNIENVLSENSRLLERLDAAVVVRDPGNARSAEVFEALRRTILLSSKSYRSHVAHLLSLKETLDRGGSLELIANRVNDFLRELGIEHIYDVSQSSAFDIVDGVGDALEIIEPAVIQWIEGNEKVIFQMGKARRVDVTRAEGNQSRSSAATIGVGDGDITAGNSEPQVG